LCRAPRFAPVVLNPLALTVAARGWFDRNANSPKNAPEPVDDQPFNAAPLLACGRDWHALLVTIFHHNIPLDEGLRFTTLDYVHGVSRLALGHDRIAVLEFNNF
jgi:hypothetical protein